MNTRSIRFRVAAWHALLLTSVFAVLGALLYATVRNYLSDTLLETQARRARQIAETLVAGIPKTGEAYVPRTIPSLYAPELGDRFIRITRSDGSVLYVSGPPNNQSFDPQRIPFAKEGAAEFSRSEDLGDGRAVLIAAFAASTSDGRHYLIEVGTSAEPVTRFTGHLLLLLAIGAPLMVSVAAAGGYMLAKSALEPVEQIARKAESITQHNLSERLPLSQTGDELERLAISLNHMITRLDEAFSNSKRFVADASHELRTPLTVIQGELESLASESGIPPEMRDRFGSLLEEVERLGKIVQKLFALSRLDAGEAQGEWVRFDLAALAEATAEQMRLLAEDKHILLSIEAADPVYIMGDRARLKQVVVNLVDNAVKYTPKGGSVNVRVVQGSTTGVLEVGDTGSGIPAELLPRVFERFFRVSRGNPSGDAGAGLGLAIVRSIVLAHGGQVEAHSVLGSGSRFTVTLPLAPAT